jgi:cell division protein FtsZ
MHEVTRAAEEVRSAADPDAVIIFGAIFDDRLRDDLRVTVIATRFADAPGGQSAPPRPARARAARAAAGRRAATPVVDVPGRLDDLALPSGRHLGGWCETCVLTG